jgi:hypothetical protein
VQCVHARYAQDVVRYLCWSYGVMVSTLDSESSDPGSNPGRTSFLRVCIFSTCIVYECCWSAVCAR